MTRPGLAIRVSRWQRQYGLWPETRAFWQLGTYRFWQHDIPRGFAWSPWPPGVYECLTWQERVTMMPDAPQDFLLQKFAPSAGASCFAEAIWTPEGIRCYAYIGYVNLPQPVFDEMEKRWTAFVDGLNEIQRIVLTTTDARPVPPTVPPVA